MATELLPRPGSRPCVCFRKFPGLSFMFTSWFCERCKLRSDFSLPYAVFQFCQHRLSKTALSGRVFWAAAPHIPDQARRAGFLLSVLFRCSRVFLRQCHTVLTAAALRDSLSQECPNFVLLTRDFFGCLGFFVVPYRLEDCFFFPFL